MSNKPTRMCYQCGAVEETNSVKTWWACGACRRLSFDTFHEPKRSHTVDGQRILEALRAGKEQMRDIKPCPVEFSEIELRVLAMLTDPDHWAAYLDQQGTHTQFYKVQRLITPRGGPAGSRWVDCFSSPWRPLERSVIPEHIDGHFRTRQDAMKARDWLAKGRPQETYRVILVCSA